MNNYIYINNYVYMNNYIYINNYVYMNNYIYIKFMKNFTHLEGFIYKNLRLYEVIRFNKNFVLRRKYVFKWISFWGKTLCFYEKFLFGGKHFVSMRNLLYFKNFVFMKNALWRTKDFLSLKNSPPSVRSEQKSIWCETLFSFETAFSWKTVLWYEIIWGNRQKTWNYSWVQE